MKTGLVLEGGGMRGMYTAGVLDVFMENGIRFDKIVGVSAGALFGVNYLSGQKGRVIRYNKRFNGDKNYMGIRPLLTEGNIVNTKYAYHDVPYSLDPFDDENFKKSDTEFYAVVTDIESGNPEYIKINSVFEQMDVLRASGSLPFVSKPVKIGSKNYLDGGISDSIPYKWMAHQDVSKIIVILTRDISYRKKETSSLLINMFYRNYPKLAERLHKRHIEYNESAKELTEIEKSGAVLVIRPSKPIEVGRMEKNPENLQEVYDLGVNDAKNMLETVMRYLNE